MRWYSAAAIFGINYPLKLFGRAAKAAVVADDDEPAYDGDSVAKFDCRDYRRRGEWGVMVGVGARCYVLALEACVVKIMGTK